MNVSESAYLTRYDPTFLESILTSKSCQVPADFFVQIADVLDLGAVERDALVRSRAFRIGRWNWSRSRESRRESRRRVKRGEVSNRERNPPFTADAHGATRKDLCGVTPELRLDEAVRSLSKRPFEPHPLIKGGHAHTIAGWAWPRRFGLYARRAHPREEERLFEVEPGVRLLARCRWQVDRTSRPTLLLVHGLGGSAASSYVLGTAGLGYQAGMNIVRL